VRQVQAQFSAFLQQAVRRVAALDEIAAEWQPDLNYAVLAPTVNDKRAIDRMHSAGATNIGWIEAAALQPGDVIAASAEHGRTTVLYRESDRHHSLFVTNRCNSRCLMCSQPPTLLDDEWLFDEAAEVVRHFRLAPDVVGITGGEPLLSPARLRMLLNAIDVSAPGTRVEVLTNGRLLGRPDIAETLLANIGAHVTWLVPLYGHADFLHDFVVQAHNAFDETIAGLLALQDHGQPIQLRVVLIEPVLQWLPALCDFIGRNLPFVDVVSLMGCEPIGYALANRDVCEVDLAERHDKLRAGARALRRRGVPFIFMNVPLCALPEDLRPHARQSISDWKNVYADECSTCAARDSCCGLFAWHERGWKPTPLKAIRLEFAS
jgi:His-Xaa-Ser system radical SAM maturase HxsC